MTEPQTAAGQALLAALTTDGPRLIGPGHWRNRIAAIEAEAREPLAAEIVRLRAALAQAEDRMQSTFDLMHPGDLTDDERQAMAQHMWFGVEEVAAALGKPSWYDNPSWSGSRAALSADAGETAT